MFGILISLWHLSMNLKSNCLLKNCWSGPIKNARILIFTCCILKRKYRKTPLTLHCVSKILMSDLQFLRNEMGNFGLFFIFLLLPQLKNPKNQKMRKITGNIIILHMYRIWYSVCQIWSMTEIIFCHFGPSFLDHFLPFYPANNLKNQNFEKMKKLLEILSFYTSVTKIMIICYTVPDTRYVTDVIFIFHFGLFFALFPPNGLKNQN